MTKTRFLALVTALVLLLTIPVTALAQNAKPHVFVGTATLDGAAAAEGTVVTALVDEAEAATGTVDAVGSYVLLLEDAVGYAGNTVAFQIGGVDADQTAAWEDGGGTELDLTATSAAAAAAAAASSPQFTSAAAGAGPSADCAPPHFLHSSSPLRAPPPQGGRRARHTTTLRARRRST